MNQFFIPKRIVVALWIAYSAQVSVSVAADISATVPVGSGFVVTNANGTQERLRVQESGVVTIPSLPTAAQQSYGQTCFSSAGQLGPCAAGVGIAEYGHVYNTAAQVVAVEADVMFDSNGVLSAGISHAPGTALFTVTAAGTYEIEWVVSGVEPNQFALFQNGAPVPGAIYGSGAGTQQNNGQALVSLSAGDVLTLRNHSSAAAVTLQTLAGGTQSNVNASVMIRKLSN